ncbi:hypothetical protein BASA60_004954 [Batrachochytrium salamandrivorans]|nr:hypothetical protein BASA60_004954 [Batrachochytrium salamandrivorans]KAH9274225.1 hypothetical protein BASA83_003533 [Batrachochytrium salamandrivorans]
MRQFLLDYPPGAYTLVTTEGRDQIPLLTAHIQRLAQSAQLLRFGVHHQLDGISKDQNSDPLQEPEWATVAMLPARDPVSLRSLIMPLIRSSMCDYFQKSPTGEAKMVVLVTLSQDRALLIAVHCDAYTTPDITKPCKVALYGNPRSNPLAKTTSWITDRRYIEIERPLGFHESILIDEHGSLYEGTTTNFVVLLTDSDGELSIVSAPIGMVLEGTILGLLEKACHKIKLRYRRVFPKLDTISTWKGAAILNAARIFSPVSHIVSGAGSEMCFQTDHSKMVALGEELLALHRSSRECVEDNLQTRFDK